MKATNTTIGWSPVIGKKGIDVVSNILSADSRVICHLPVDQCSWKDLKLRGKIIAMAPRSHVACKLLIEIVDGTKPPYSKRSLESVINFARCAINF